MCSTVLYNWYYQKCFILLIMNNNNTSPARTDDLYKRLKTIKTFKADGLTFRLFILQRLIQIGRYA